MSKRKRTHQLLQEHWGTAIRMARGQRSQTWLAAAINVDQTTISRIERGIYRLSPELMVGIAAALDRELAELFAFPPGLVTREQYEQEIRQLRAEAALPAAGGAA